MLQGDRRSYFTAPLPEAFFGILRLNGSKFLASQLKSIPMPNHDKVDDIR